MPVTGLAAAVCRIPRHRSIAGRSSACAPSRMALDAERFMGTERADHHRRRLLGEIMKLLATGEAMKLPVEISARRITACLATTAMISS